MIIHKRLVPEMTIEEFADQQGFEMVVVERPSTTLQSHYHNGENRRFYAHFASVELCEGNVLVGTYGEGPTIEAAIADYAGKISERRVAKDAYRDDRKEVMVPRLLAAPPSPEAGAE
jgi:hypothetical protein